MAERKRRYFDVISGDADRRDAPPQPERQHIGHVLRQRREELGYDLPAMAANLRIRQPYLEAIEDGRYADLPGQAYVTGFLRAYAQALGLEPGPVLARFKEETADVQPSAELYFPEPVNESRVPGGAILLVAGVLAAFVYAGWYVLSSTDRGIADIVAPLPTQLADRTFGKTEADAPPPAPILAPDQAEALVGRSQPTAPEVGAQAAAVPTRPSAAETVPPAAPSAAPPATSVSAPPTAAHSAAQSAAPPPSAAPPTAPAPASSPAASATTASAPPVATEPPTEEEGELPPIPDLGQSAVPDASVETDPLAGEDTPPAPPPAGPALPAGEGGRVFGVAEGPVRIEVRAVLQSWIEVRDSKGTLWASRILRPGDVFRAPDVPGLTMVTGNAGGLAVTLDGRELPPLGGKDQVMRNIGLTPEALRSR